jgi:sec-independent protein translocase protein TatA
MPFGSFGMGEMIFIFLIVLLLFGAKRLPEIGSSLGKGIREFKSSVKDIERELSVPPERNQIHRTNAPPPPAVQAPSSPAQQDTQRDEGEPRKLSSSVSATTDDRGQSAS